MGSTQSTWGLISRVSSRTYRFRCHQLSTHFKNGQSQPAPLRQGRPGPRPHRLPGTVLAGQGRVCRRVQEVYYHERQGARQAGRHPDPFGVRARGQEDEVKKKKKKPQEFMTNIRDVLGFCTTLKKFWFA